MTGGSVAGSHDRVALGEQTLFLTLRIAITFVAQASLAGGCGVRRKEESDVQPGRSAAGASSGLKGRNQATSSSRMVRDEAPLRVAEGVLYGRPCHFEIGYPR